MAMDGKVKLTKNPEDFVDLNEITRANLCIMLDIMNNCLDTIYDVTKIRHPDVYRPELFLSNSSSINAYADYNNKRIVINLGLFFNAIPLIERYQKEILDKYEILSDQDVKHIQSGIRVSLWRFVILHELYHLWNGHAQWRRKYYVNKNGNIVTNKKSAKKYSAIISEVNKTNNSNKMSKRNVEANITSQAIELDADASAVCMLINLLFLDMKNRGIEANLQKDYIKINMAYIIAGISSAFCMFDKNAGGKFELLEKLEWFTHPIPAIRFIYAEEIAELCLEHHVNDVNDIIYIESEWQKIICDIESDYKGIVDMGQVYFFPAYTEDAQHHLLKVKKRLNSMNETLREVSLIEVPPKLPNEAFEFDPKLVLFDKKGRSLRGWVNPATGKNVALRIEKRPITTEKKPGRNEPCPCGSGKKYKKCCGST